MKKGEGFHFCLCVLLHRPVIPGAEERPQRRLLEGQVCQQVLFQIAEGGDELGAALAAGVRRNVFGNGGDTFGDMVDYEMVFLQTVNHVDEGRLQSADRRKERRVLDGMVGVDEAAAIKTAELESPQRTIRLQRTDRGQDRFGRVTLSSLLS